MSVINQMHNDVYDTVSINSALTHAMLSSFLSIYSISVTLTSFNRLTSFPPISNIYLFTYRIHCLFYPDFPLHIFYLY